MNDDQASLFIRGDLIQKKCDHIFWNNAHPDSNRNFQAGDIVFCKIDQVMQLFEVLRLTRKKIILVTGEGDLSCDAFRQQFLPTNVVRWFATNVTHAHPRVTAIPLGLGSLQDRVTLDEAIIHEAKKEILLRNQWLYVNFRPETNFKVRKKIHDFFQALAQQEKWVTLEFPNVHAKRYDFAKQLLQHRFVLAPPGNGIDTHRLWEALLAGAYPIVLKSAAMKTFESLPILMVDSYEQITWDFLKEQFQFLEEKKQSLLMTQEDFWEKAIEAEKINLQTRKKITRGEWLYESCRYACGMMKRRYQGYN